MAIEKADGWIVYDQKGMHRFATKEEAEAYEKGDDTNRSNWYGEADKEECEDCECDPCECEEE